MTDSASPSASPLRSRRSRTQPFPPLSGPSLAAFLPSHFILSSQPDAQLQTEVETAVEPMPELAPASSPATLPHSLFLRASGGPSFAVACVLSSGEWHEESGSPSHLSERELFRRMWGAIGLNLVQQVGLLSVTELGRSRLSALPQEGGAAAHEVIWREWLAAQGQGALQVVVAVGFQAAQDLLGAGLISSSEDFRQRRGQLFAWGALKILLTDEPSVLLQNPALKKDSWEDLKRVAALLGLSLPSPPSQGTKRR